MEWTGGDENGRAPPNVPQARACGAKPAGKCQRCKPRATACPRHFWPRPQPSATLKMGVSTVELKGLSVRTKHEEPGLWALQAPDLGQSYALSLRLGLEGRPACPRHCRYDLIIVARAEQGGKQARVAANGLFGRRRQRHSPCLDDGPDMADARELADVAGEPVRHVDRALGEIAQDDGEFAMRPRTAIALDDMGEVLLRKFPITGERGLRQHAKAEISIADGAGHIEMIAALRPAPEHSMALGHEAERGDGDAQGTGSVRGIAPHESDPSLVLKRLQARGEGLKP